MVKLIPEGRRKVVGRKCSRCDAWWLLGSVEHQGCVACSAGANEVGCLTQGEVDDDRRSGEAVKADKSDDDDIYSIRAQVERKAFRDGYRYCANYVCSALSLKLRSYELDSIIENAIRETHFEAAKQEKEHADRYYGGSSDV